MVEVILTERQRMIISLMQAGHTQAEIAEKIGISLRSVKWEAAKMRKEAGVKRTRELVRLGDGYMK